MIGNSSPPQKKRDGSDHIEVGEHRRKSRPGCSVLSILSVRHPSVSRWSYGERLISEMLLWELSSKR